VNTSADGGDNDLRLRRQSQTSNPIIKMSAKTIEPPITPLTTLPIMRVCSEIVDVDFIELSSLDEFVLGEFTADVKESSKVQLAVSMLFGYFS
jgi:hypothetical protein